MASSCKDCGSNGDLTEHACWCETGHVRLQQA
jgi:hypothetical protein